MQRNDAQPFHFVQGLSRTGLVMACLIFAIARSLTYPLTWSILSDIMHTLRMPYLASLLAGVGVTHGRIYDTRFNGTTWDDANWRITTNQLDQGHYQSRMSLANGYLGINVAAAGPFFEADTPVDGDNINGWPLFDRRQTFATISGFWDEQPTTNGTNFEWLNQYGGESVISGVPHWSGLHVKIGDEVLDASVPDDQISGFTSTLDLHAGTMQWSYTWSPSAGPAINVEYEMFVHKLYVNLAVVQLKLTSSQNVNVTVIDLLNGDGALRTDFVDKNYEPVLPFIWSAVRPLGISNVTAYIYSALVRDVSYDNSTRTQITDESLVGANSSSIAQGIDVSLQAGKTSTITKYVGGASTDAFEDPQTTALNASWSAAQQGYVKLLSSHIAEWASIMTPDSVDNYRYPNGSLPDDPNVLELQITAVTNPFHLLKETVGANAIIAAGNNSKLAANSIAVGGLGSDSYGGMIFW
jgi:trehalose/maltose hydrolase-like predicted phosphorylase